MYVDHITNCVQCAELNYNLKELPLYLSIHVYSVSRKENIRRHLYSAHPLTYNITNLSHYAINQNINTLSGYTTLMSPYLYKWNITFQKVLQTLSPMSSILADLFLHSTEQARHLFTSQNDDPSHFFALEILPILLPRLHLKSIPTQLVKLLKKKTFLNKTSLCKAQYFGICYSMNKGTVMVYSILNIFVHNDIHLPPMDSIL